MAPRSFWKGYLKLSLVTCPISMTPATSAGEKVRFHTINAKTGNRIESRYVDAVTGKPLTDKDEVKGYEVAEDKHVMLEDDELAAVALESTRTIDIEKFVPADSIGWIWLDKPHYIAPDDKVGEEAFAVIRDAMRSTKTVGISRVVLYRRERAVMLEPRGKGIVLWTLRYGDEVRDDAEYFADIEKEKPDPKVIKLVKSLIDDRTAEWSPKLVEDPVQDKLKKIIAAKKKKQKPLAAKTKSEPEPETPSNVVSIMDALKKSIAKEKAGKT
ncbi:non-homologous end joining protein Ku [Aliihoeflea sp. PC F10.4]